MSLFTSIQDARRTKAGLTKATKPVVVRVGKKVSRTANEELGVEFCSLEPHLETARSGFDEPF